MWATKPFAENLWGDNGKNVYDKLDKLRGFEEGLVSLRNYVREKNAGKKERQEPQTSQTTKTQEERVFSPEASRAAYLNNLVDFYNTGVGVEKVISKYHVRKIETPEERQGRIGRLSEMLLEHSKGFDIKGIQHFKTYAREEWQKALDKRNPNFVDPRINDLNMVILFGSPDVTRVDAYAAAIEEDGKIVPGAITLATLEDGRYTFVISSGAGYMQGMNFPLGKVIGSRAQK
jgi:hypothetical protein